MRINLIHFSAVLAASMIGAPQAVAHHSFAAEFDREQTVEVTGTVTKIEWTNPHARFYVDATDPDLDDETFNWNFEMGTPNVLMRAGWRRDSLKIGDVVTVSGWRAKNEPHVANARDVTNSDGERLFAGSSFRADSDD